jgi:hypothetical protein
MADYLPLTRSFEAIIRKTFAVSSITIPEDPTRVGHLLALTVEMLESGTAWVVVAYQ